MYSVVSASKAIPPKLYNDQKVLRELISRQLSLQHGLIDAKKDVRNQILFSAFLSTVSVGGHYLGAFEYNKYTGITLLGIMLVLIVSKLFAGRRGHSAVVRRVAVPEHEDDRWSTTKFAKLNGRCIDIATLPPYQLPSLKLAGSKAMTMGLSKLDQSQWLSIDADLYMNEHVMRAELLAKHRSQVFNCLPGSEAACWEALNLGVAFLTSRYPQFFSLVAQPGSRTHAVVNHFTGETLHIHPELVPLPLELLARLAQEDFNILMKSEVDGQWHLMASATLFPAGWKLEERVGGTLQDLHGPVPNWARKLGCPANRFLDHSKSRNCYERRPMFVQTGGDYFKDSDINDRDDTTSEKIPVSFEDLYVRQERQTFRPLVKSGAVLFAVHTFMRKMADLGDDELVTLVANAENWDDDMAQYKARDEWLEAAKAGMTARGLSGIRAGEKTMSKN